MTTSTSENNKTLAAPDIVIHTYPGRIRAKFSGFTVADSQQVIQINEGNLDPMFYFPHDDVRVDLLEATDHHSYCPFRGEASYWSLKVGDKTTDNIAWSYQQPFEEAREISGHIAFYKNQVELKFDTEEPTTDHRESGQPHRINPLLHWLVGEAAGAVTTRDLIERFTRALEHAEIPVSRFWLSLRTLHPQLYSMAWTWEQGKDDVNEDTINHETLSSDAFRNSPIVPILEGAGGVRRRLDIENPQLDYPIVRDLHAQGASDYVAMPFLFSDGQINALSITSKTPGGFSADHLANIYEILPLFSRLLEVHTGRTNSITLLETYLGKQSGRQVLDGQIRRGDGMSIHAVIWFCDLRGSTTLAETLSKEEFLALLNRYFDCLAGPVLHHGGEVLRFIGDAALAIFPIHGDKPEAIAKACAAALAAAQDARKRILENNTESETNGQPEIDYGIGLHVGEVTYGNIGTENRLEFTVIGAAANEAARIESLCKTLGQKILISEEFSRHTSEDLVSMGQHTLRGVGKPQDIYALDK
jgi:adenylate cyclase